MTAAPSPAPPPPQFAASITPVTAEMLEHSWRPGCPVGPERLRIIEASHWDFQGRVANGQLVVREDQAEAVVEVLRRLFELRFPIERMRPVDEYGGDDDASMAANNTSGFNCRAVESRPGVLSQHAYGIAIDVNPVQNPYVRGGRVDPPAGAAYTDRSRTEAGMVRGGGGVIEAFAAIGWGWGGHWSNSKDYQHFSLSGR